MDLKWRLKLFCYRVTKFLRSFGLNPRRLILFGILLISSLIFLAMKWKLLCTNQEAQSYLDTLCANYKKGLVIGDFCSEFCNDQKSLRVDSCQTRHFGKEVVFSAIWNDKQIFVKGFSVDLDHPDLNKIYQIDETNGNEKSYPSFSDFESTVERYLEDNMAIIPPGMVFRTFLKRDFGLFENEKDSRVAMENLWTLVQSNEFVFSQLFEQFDVFPEVYGTCGSVFAVEKLSPLPVPGSSYETNHFQNWSHRVAIALKILDLLEELETIFDQPLLLCDIKTEHFGISEHGRVKVLDIDNVGFKSVIDKIVGNQDNCSSHSDCDYFDCKGVCDLIESKCIGPVTNNNLQVVCEKVLLSPPHSSVFYKIPGLLTSKHMHKKLKNILQKCSNPTGAKDSTRISADDQIRKELTRMLKEIVTIAQKVLEE